ncbi:unnamed protein product, partial [Allacma fusca]
MQLTYKQIRKAIASSQEHHEITDVDGVILLAENIYSEESKLADLILEMKYKRQKAETNSELKFLYSIMRQDPAVISMGNYFELKKKLLIT